MPTNEEGLKIIKCGSNKEKRSLKRKLIVAQMGVLAEVVAPIADLLAIKKMDMLNSVATSERLEEWIKNNPECSNEEAAEQLANEGDAILKKLLHEQSAFRSFAGHSEQGRMQAAADYSDVWCETANTAFRCYYICRAGHADWPCNTAMASKKWDIFHSDPMASKQRWYCKFCNSRYKTKFGVLVELKVHDEVMYVLADLPPDDLKDAKWMQIERRFKAFDTPQALYDALPEIQPLDTTHFFKEIAEGVFRFDGQLFEKIPKLEWYQLYNLTPKEAQVPKRT
ncbi:MAG: hypothetical protein L6R35_007566 [Caloplaca aegaea]|nr:MAG: hypothetical protein L6R35_007566 [Caloplaca aegaea]